LGVVDDETIPRLIVFELYTQQRGLQVANHIPE